jgi:hypothetical protein
MTFDEWFKTIEVEVFDNFEVRMYPMDLKNWMREAWDEAYGEGYDDGTDDCFKAERG